MLVSRYTIISRWTNTLMQLIILIFHIGTNFLRKKETPSSNSSCEVRCYKLRTLELVKRKNLVLGLTQENSMENSVQDCLSYILKPHGLYYTTSSLS